MKIKPLPFMGIFLLAVIMSSMVLIGITISEFPPDPPGEYSAWADLNDDGNISIYDLVWMAGRYGTTGIPSKNVNVTNWPSIQNVSVTNWPDYLQPQPKAPINLTLAVDETLGAGDSWFSERINVTGYNQITLYHKGEPGLYRVRLQLCCGTIIADAAHVDAPGDNSGIIWSYHMNTESRGPEVRIGVHNPGGGPTTFSLSIYINE